MSSGMSNRSNPEQEIMGLMEDLAEILRAEVLPTHLPLVQLINKLCEDPTLKQVDLYSKYTRLAAVVAGDWITVKEELRSATRFGAPAFYCSISAMLAIFTCRRSRIHDELVSSLTELYSNISTGNEALNKHIENAITTMGKQMEHANKAVAILNKRVDIALTKTDKQTEHANIADARIANIVEQTENAVTTIGKQVEKVNRAEVAIANIIGRADHATTTMEKQVNKAEVSITNIIERADQATTMMERQVNTTEAIIANIIERADNAINTTGNQIKQTNVSESMHLQTASQSTREEYRQDNVSVVPIPGTTYRCKHGTLTIDDRYQCVFNGGSLEAKSLAMWFTLPVSIGDLKTLLNWDHEHLIRLTTDKLPSLHAFKHTYDASQKRPFFNTLITVNKIQYKPGQWSYIF